MNRLEKNIIISMAEDSVLSDSRKISIKQQVFLLSVGLKTDQIEDLEQALNSLRDKRELIIGWNFDDLSYEIELSDKLKSPDPISLNQPREIFK